MHFFRTIHDFINCFVHRDFDRLLVICVPRVDADSNPSWQKDGAVVVPSVTRGDAALGSERITDSLSVTATTCRTVTILLRLSCIPLWK